MLKNFIYVGISSVSIKQTEHYVAKRSFPQRRKEGGKLRFNSLMGMCRWIGSLFHDWIDYKRVEF